MASQHKCSYHGDSYLGDEVQNGWNKSTYRFATKLQRACRTLADKEAILHQEFIHSLLTLRFNKDMPRHH